MNWIRLEDKQPEQNELVFSLIVYHKDASENIGRRYSEDYSVNVGHYRYNEKHKQHRIVYYDLTYHYAGDELGVVYWMRIPDLLNG